MKHYVVNKNAQSNGDHEVHSQGCSYYPDPENREHLGNFSSCRGAVAVARREHYDQVNGCYYCASACHTQ